MFKNAIWIFIICFSVLVYFLPSYTQWQDKRQKNIEYSEQIRSLKQHQKALYKEKYLLENDPVYLEKVAREKMGLVKEGEVVYKLQPAENSQK